MATTTAPPAGANGAVTLPKPGAVRHADITSLETAMVLRGFEELKTRGEGEFKVAVRRNGKSGLVEIVFCGISEKADLGPLRKLYQQAQDRGVTI